MRQGWGTSLAGSPRATGWQGTGSSDSVWNQDLITNKSVPSLLFHGSQVYKIMYINKLRSL